MLQTANIDLLTAAKCCGTFFRSTCVAKIQHYSGQTGISHAVVAKQTSTIGVQQIKCVIAQEL